MRNEAQGLLPRPRPQGEKGAVARVGLATALSLFLTGCGSTPAPTAPTDVGPAPIVSPISPEDLPTSQALAAQSLDPLPTPRKLYEITIYTLAVPVGTISTNEEFWKRVDEDAIDPVTHQTQQWNGIRVGVAPVAEMDHLRKFVDDPEAKQSSVVSNRADNLSLELATNIREQRLLWYDATGALKMRDFESCENRLYFTFRQPLRRPDKIDLAMSPAVRSQRFELRYTRGEERPIEFVQPEYLYDLGLKLELPLDKFVVIAPGSVSRDLSNAGRVFFTRDDPAQQMERIIVIVPSLRGTIQEVPVTSDADNAGR